MLLKLFILTFIITVVDLLAMNYSLVWEQPAKNYEQDSFDSDETFSCDACGIDENGACTLELKSST